MFLRFLLSTILAGSTVLPTMAAELISPSNQWHYYDKPMAPGANWNHIEFNHSSWKTGYGEFGYGDHDENTRTAFGDDPQNKTITQYFVKSFQVPDLSLIKKLSLRLLADDGGVVYINGIEVFRLNIADNQNHNTLADGILIESFWIEETLSKHTIHSGENLIAVEVHQISKFSSDLSFDLALISH